MKDVNLSKRMETVVSMISPQSFAIAAVEENGDSVQAVYDKQTSLTIADVGCDHAYVSIALVNRNIADKVIAMDVRTGPLDIARRNVAESGLANKIDIRLGDGLEKLVPGEADAIIIAGMGGLLIKGILERGIHILKCKEKRPVLILQPQSDLKEVRMFLLAHAYDIVSECMLLEDGKYYTVMKAKPCECDMESCISMTETCSGNGHIYTDEELVYGRYNLEHQNSVLQEYLLKEREVFLRIAAKVKESMAAMEAKGEQIPVSTRERLKSVTYELELNAKALQYYSEVIM